MIYMEFHGDRNHICTGQADGEIIGDDKSMSQFLGGCQGGFRVIVGFSTPSHTGHEGAARHLVAGDIVTTCRSSYDSYIVRSTHMQ